MSEINSHMRAAYGADYVCHVGGDVLLYRSAHAEFIVRVKGKAFTVFSFCGEVR